MTYTGVIKPHYEVSAKNDSIFDIGVLDTPEQMMLMIDPLDQGNAGRFINTAEPECLNCIAQLGMYVPSMGEPEPTVIIVASKDIHSGHELFYNYGKGYGRMKAKKNTKK